MFSRILYAFFLFAVCGALSLVHGSATAGVVANWYIPDACAEYTEAVRVRAEPRAMYHLAICIDEKTTKGIVSHRSAKSSVFKWLNAASTHGVPMATMLLAEWYWKAEPSRGVKYKNRKKALDLYEKVAATLCLSSSVYPPDSERNAIVMAQMTAGGIYAVGLNVTTPHPTKSFQYFQKAVIASKDPAAQFMLGLQYQEGDGVPADAAAAVVYFERAAVQGFYPAQFMTAKNHAEGRGNYKKSFSKARKWLKKGLALNRSEALWLFHSFYKYGLMGVEIDEEKAKKYKWNYDAIEPRSGTTIRLGLWASYDWGMQNTIWSNEVFKEGFRKEQKGQTFQEMEARMKMLKKERLFEGLEKRRNAKEKERATNANIKEEGRATNANIKEKRRATNANMKGEL